MQSKILLTIAAIALLEATIAGAVASHVLNVDERTLASFETAVDFEFFHGLGLLALVALGFDARGGRARAAAAWLIVAGMVLFCGSIYLVTFGAPRGLLSLAPYGGVAFMLAWVLVAASPWLGATRTGTGA